MFQWLEALENVTCPCHQLEILNEVLLNIFSNFTLIELANEEPRDVSWITRSIKSMSYRKNDPKKNRVYTTFMRNGQPDDKAESSKI